MSDFAIIEFHNPLKEAIGVLNEYRNRWYTAPSHTDEGQVANALNTVLPTLLTDLATLSVKLDTAEALVQKMAEMIDEYEDEKEAGWE